MKTLDIILIIVAVLIASFVVAMIITFWVFQSVPDTLITAVLSGGIIELICTALITITKQRHKIKGSDEE